MVCIVIVKFVKKETCLVETWTNGKFLAAYNKKKKKSRINNNNVNPSKIK